MKKITTSNGYDFIVDDEDEERVSRHVWHGGTSSSGSINIRRLLDPAQPLSKVQYLGRFILNAPDGKFVRHINNDPLDNRRGNLLLTARQGEGSRVKRVVYPCDRLGCSNTREFLPGVLAQKKRATKHHGVYCGGSCAATANEARKRMKRGVDNRRG